MVDDLAGRTLGGFRLREPLGEGAHGSVWRATQLRLDRDVAVKVLDPVVARNPETVRRFEREGRAAASLDHPNVVPVYEAGEADGLVYLAMRLVEGATLEEHAAAAGPFTPDEVADLLAPVAAALEHAHERGLVHRDVKPSNILLEGDRIYLADFGIAASVRELGNYTTGALGTAEYMAPEQAQGPDVDHRADVYGLGCVAHFLLEGHPPFVRDDLVATLLAHTSDPVPSVGDETRDRFYAAALAKDPDDRFASATALVEGLRSPDRVVAPAPPAAEPGTGSSGGKEGRPRVVLAALAAVVAIAAVIGVVLALGGDDEPADADETVAPADAADAAAAGDDGGEDTDDPEAAETGADGGDGGDEAEDVAEPVGPVSVVGGEVDIATVRPLDSINPHQDRLAESYITGHVLPPLVVLADDWTLEPWLAASLPEIISTEPLTTRWVLRDDAVWDDGTPITTTDVARTLDYVLDPAAATEATVLHEGLEFTIVDEITFELVHTGVTETHEIVFSTLHPVIKAEAYDDHVNAGNDPATFLAEGIGFSGGPFRVAGFDPEQRVTLVRNDAWWGDPAPLDRITIRRFDAAADQVDALAAGDVDIAYLETPTAALRGDLEAIEGVSIDAGVADRRLRLDMNTARGPTAELAVRLAIATAINRAEVAEAATTSITREPPAGLESLVWTTAHPSNLEPFAAITADTAEAESLLQQAGWELGEGGARFKDGEVLELRLIYDRFNSLLGQSVAQNLVVALDEVGIRVVADVLDVDEASTARATGDFDIAVVTALGDADPVSSQFRWHSRACPATFAAPGCEDPVGTNVVGLVNPDIDALLDTAAGLNGDERVTAYQAVDARLAEILPAVPLFEMPVLVAFDDDLGEVDVAGHRHGPFAHLDRWARLETSGS